MYIEVYDVECMRNLFTYTGYCRTQKKWFQFVIHKTRNNLIELIKHLRREGLAMVGYNNLSYDYPLLHHILNHYDEYVNLPAEELTRRLYQKSQEIIEMQFSVIADKNTIIPQIDVFKINHWDNPAKATSLKHCEMAMRMHNIEEMPIPHWQIVNSLEEVQMILDYNKHDVHATDLVFDYCLGKTDHAVYKGRNKLALRQLLSKNFKLNLLNHNDVKIGEDLVFKLYAKASEIPEYVLKKQRTMRPSINLKDCIPSYVEFHTNTFKKMLKKWKETTINSTKGAFKEKVPYHGILLEYGTGGVHGSNKGIFVSDDDYIIVDADVGSMYPSIIAMNGYYPEHLGEFFLKLYSHFLNTRLSEKEKPKKERNPVIMEGYKLMVNGIYGKFNSETSPFYDPLVAMSTTITGQLSLTMLIESLTSSINEIEWIQANTDGITARIPRKHLDTYYKICREWENKTKLTLEYAIYKKMCVRDVSNYLAIFEKMAEMDKEGNVHYYNYNEVKLKGCFEIDKELHKDPGMRIVPIALKKYFVDGIPVEETIRNHKDIFDFCLELKINKDYETTYKFLGGEDKREIFTEKLGRITRYFISGSNGTLLKSHKTDGRVTHIDKGYGIKIFNKYYEAEDYDINYNYYSIEARKIINKIENDQLSLF